MSISIVDEKKKVVNSISKAIAISGALLVTVIYIRDAAIKLSIDNTKQLAELSYENSHSLRASLARMLGLLHLIQIDPDRKDFYLSKLDDQALEMDRRLCLVSKSIERNMHE